MKLFNVTNNNETCHKVITICGLQIKIKSKKLKEKQRIKNLEQKFYELSFEFHKLKNAFIEINSTEFLTTPIRNNSILLIEPNFCHGEVLPGMARYFLDLGYNVDVIMDIKGALFCPFAKMQHPNLRLFNIELESILAILENNLIKHYAHIYMNTSLIFSKKNTSFLTLQEPLSINPEKFIHMVHDTKYLDEYEGSKTKILMLAKLPKATNNVSVVNAHYFGNIKIYPKNNITNFIVVGNILPQCKNFDLLINSIIKLVNQGYKNFKITIIARLGNLEHIPENIRDYIDFKGRLSYPDLYDEMEKADFFLPLLDPEVPEHDRYVTTGTSGSFQLIYGFLTPCIINSKFASIPGFDNQNSFIYDKNEELADKMIEAINMSNEDYDNKRANLKNLADSIYKQSLENLKNLLEDNK